MNWQRAYWFAVHLRVDCLAVCGKANYLASFPGEDALHFAELAEPESRERDEITEAAFGGVSDNFEIIFEEARAGGDLEWAAIICGAAYDDQRRVQI